MNKRQIKKRVKRSKLNKECGMILSLEDRHYIRNYGKYYYINAEADKFLINWDELNKSLSSIVDGMREAFADMFQGWADALRRNGGAAE